MNIHNLNYNNFLNRGVIITEPKNTTYYIDLISTF